MSAASRANPIAARVRAGFDKLRWGARVTGWPAALRGVLRLAHLAVARPATAEVRLRSSGATLAFSYPVQMVPALVMFGDLIDPEYAFLEAVAKPGWTFLDVGAAIGQFTVFAAVATRGRVHAFEPSSDNIATLQHNVAKNAIDDRVTVHRIAMANHTGEAEFATADNAFMSRLDTNGAGTGDRVPVDTLTNVVERLRIEHVSVLKVNVAGFEPEVLAGARAVLARGFADILVLLIGLRSFDAYRDLAALGYRFFFFHPRERRLHEVPSLDEEGLVRNRPWPARHVLAIWSNSVESILGDSIRIHPAR